MKLLLLCYEIIIFDYLATQYCPIVLAHQPCQYPYFALLLRAYQ